MAWKKSTISVDANLEDTDELPQAQRAAAEVLIKGTSNTELYHLAISKLLEEMTAAQLLTILEAMDSDQQEDAREALDIEIIEEWHPELDTLRPESTLRFAAPYAQLERYGNLIRLTGRFVGTTSGQFAQFVLPSGFNFTSDSADITVVGSQGTMSLQRGIISIGGNTYSDRRVQLNPSVGTVNFVATWLRT